MATARIAALSALLVSLPAAAFDPFEIQIYDGTLDDPLHGGLEIHANQAPGEFHLTFEPSLGITRFWELGGYLETRKGKYEGWKLRSKFIAPLESAFRLGVNFELSKEQAGWGGEIRPIFAFENDRFLLAVNPNIEIPLAFAPAAMAKVKIGPIAIGPEYYGTLPDEHYLFGAIDLIAWKNVELNLAVGGGTATIGKMIVGYVF
jgi:hypothetical protein